MRQVFTSPRVENVEGVARMLEEAGIEVRITHGRGWKGAIRGNFSYRDHAPRGPQPAVWVIRSDQQPQARELLRDAGLLQSTRPDAGGFVAPTLHAGTPGAAASAQPPGRRIRLGLLLTIGAVMALAYGGFRRAASNADAEDALAARRSAPPVAVPAIHTIPTPPALAEMLVGIETGSRRANAYCVAIDGRDPDAATLARLRAASPKTFPASACPASGDRLALDVRDYATDGTGVGTVRLEVSGPGADDAGATSRAIEVERNGLVWRVRRELPATAD